MLQAVSVDSFGWHVLVVEDDPIVRESIHCEELLEARMHTYPTKRWFLAKAIPINV